MRSMKRKTAEEGRSRAFIEKRRPNAGPFHPSFLWRLPDVLSMGILRQSAAKGSPHLGAKGVKMVGCDAHRGTTAQKVRRAGP